MPFPNPAAMFAALDPAEVERKIGELRVIENWLAMSLNMMQMSIKTMELQKASLEAMRAGQRRRSRSRKERLNMSITLYYGSGSPYAWRVQLALEHKALAYERKVLSFSAGDTRKPEFLALNPRHRVPVIVDGDFVLYESNAIVEYLDEAYPATGRAAVSRRRAQSRAGAPADLRGRQLHVEGDRRRDHVRVLQKARGARPAKLAEGKRRCSEEYAMFGKAMRGDFLAGDLSAADFALYPMVAFIERCAVKLPDFDPTAC